MNFSTNESPGMGRPRVGVAALMVRGGQVLLVRRTGAHGAGSWSTPGGHLEAGESPEECAQREALEEVGVMSRAVRFLALTNDVFEAEGKHYITLWMQCEILDGEPYIAAPQESSDLGWFAWDNLPSPLFIPLENLLQGKCYPPDGVRGGIFPG